MGFTRGPLRAVAHRAGHGYKRDVGDNGVGFGEGFRRILETWNDPRIGERIDRLSRANLNAFGFDPFGYSPDYLKRVLPAVAVFYRHYFRVETHHIDRVPTEGRALFVANHSGQLPVDGAMIGTSLLLDLEPPRILRAMVERWVPTLPHASVFMSRCGQVVGTPENCRALLEDDEAILVFPEGSAGISKTYDRRYQLQRFGYGFMRLALEMKAPIIPVAVVGAEEQAVSLYDWRAAARLVGAPAFPITPLTPLLGPLGILPMPVKYHLLFGEPLTFVGDPNDEDGRVGRHVRHVKNAIRGLIEEGLRVRKGVFS